MRALIGLDLTFWCRVLLYIETEEYTMNTILNATAISLLTTLDQTIEELTRAIRTRSEF